MKCSFVDTTLRDGIQAPGVYLNRFQRRMVAESLVKAGFSEMEAGIPAMGEEEKNNIRDLNDLPLRLICWCRAKNEDLEAAASCRTDAVHISFPVSSRMRELTGWDTRTVTDRLKEILKKAFGDFGFVSAGFMDAFRTPFRTIKPLIETALEAGVRRIRLADTVGTVTPRGINNLADHLSDFLPFLEFHGHNDLGLATANALEAVESGFGAVSGTLMGLGERAGNTSWEQLFMVLHLGGRDGLEEDVGLTASAARELAALLNRPIAPEKPIIGDQVFCHESGIHTAGFLKDPLTFQPFRPEDFGLRKGRVVFSRQSGRRSLKELFASNQLPCDEEDVSRFKDWLHQTAPPGLLPEDYLIQSYKKTLARSTSL